MKFFRWVRYSGVWFGFVMNPCHWQLKWKTNTRKVYDNTLYFGPLWITVIFDDGSW